MVLKKSASDYRPRRIPVPLLLNMVLFGIGIMAFILFSRTYRTQLDLISSQENRFVTMEWELLQELKRQTDIQLLEKDREIADLRRQYRILMTQNASKQALQELELRISIAGSERDSIASRDPLPVGSATEKISFFTGKKDIISDPVQLTSLLAARIETLAAQLRERQVYARTLQEQLSAAGMTPETLIPGEEKQWQERERQAAAYRDLVSKSKKTFSSVQNDLELLLADEIARSRKPVDNLESWVLLRAIATSPAIRSEYPDLAVSMNRYLESFAEKEKATGRTEAYTQALDTLEPLGVLLTN